jgi:hypothetical protein
MTAAKKNMPAPGVERPLIWAIKGLPGAEGAPTARRGAPWSRVPSEADTSMPDLAMFVWGRGANPCHRRAWFACSRAASLGSVHETSPPAAAP